MAEIETADLTVDKYVIMPNHIHLIIKICTPKTATRAVATV
ncbi:transposase [Lachnoclostridium sp. MSJ-17]|nr:transposase [Lachnoclostridium sp. MSJ-17]